MDNFEKLVIGSILLDNNCLATVEAIIDHTDFYNLDYSEAFRATVELSKKGKPVDEFTLGDELSGQKYKTNLNAIGLSEITENTTSAYNVGYYSEMVKDKSLKRKVNGLGVILQDEDLSGSEAVEEAIKQLTSISQGSSKTMHDIDDCITGFLSILDAKMNGDIVNQTTGFKDIDEMIDGLVDGRLYVVGGRPGSGKTALSLNFALAAAKSNLPVQIFNMEMPKEEVSSRLISAAGVVNMKHPKKMDDSDWARFTAGTVILKKAHIKVDDSTGYKVGHIKNSIRIHHKEYGKTLIIIDYLQLINYDGDNANTGYSLITRDLKSLAKELKIPIVLLAQVNRGCESRLDKRPLSSDLRDSGGIESDADCIMMCYRDEVYNENSDMKGIAEVLIRKNRQGSSGKVLLKSKLQYFLFESLNPEFISQG